MQAETFAKIHPRQFLQQFLAQGVRPDGRRLLKARPASVARGTVSSADGSALARVGRTTAVCGIKLEVGTPEAVAPADGRLEVQVLQTPLSDPTLSVGRPSAASVAMGAAIRALVVGCGAVPLGELGIEEGKSAWVVYADVYCAAFDGNLLDAAFLAVVAALQDLRVPATRTDEDGEVVIAERRPYARALNMPRVPVPATFGLVGEHVLSDPSADEEPLLDASCTVVLDEAGNVCSVHKPGGAPIGGDALSQCLAAAGARARALHKALRR